MQRSWRWLAAAALVASLGWTESASAQVTYGNPGGYVRQPVGGPGFGPNVFNRQYQPISPYLNLLNNGNNPAVNYYYNVRPGVPAGGFVGPSGQFNPLQQRQGYFGSVPTFEQSVDPNYNPDSLPESYLSPTGHGSSFYTHRNYYSVPGAYRGGAGAAVGRPMTAPQRPAASTGSGGGNSPTR
ncbi:hypothetical protein [Tuwongella immobilis]|uniref:Secreted protein n=1 Tax=Tuwongella immobilis TaxID=692036 RepID=A0A6C2YJ05_9BACT|nr:hypothetical protein [Tuwongella immobilis]VIP00962.1 unnamed protein product [Tuwongella immobilis]VTR97342.1 unnamed protein product [Tuwongella immobilis]